ncbi:MAG: LrgB family protein [Pseudomonadota bacterium]
MSGAEANDAFEIWIYLAQTPLLGLTLTLAAYCAGLWIYARAGAHPLLNPVLIAVALLAAVLLATDTPYDVYFDGAQFAHFLLGPATVALAIPLYRVWRQARQALAGVAAALVAGSAAAVAVAAGVAWALGASPEAVLSITPKSVTTPIAMGVAEEIGGLPSLTAVMVILTGVLGAVLGPLALDALRVRDWRARGLAIGVASHGIGAARALSVNATAGAFAALAMGLNAMLTAIALPAAVALFVG